ncbi:NADH-quinone oxidoreductase subunit H [Actinomadura graeca]|uniref:NADH-quinone oxidoreductase subunit H n=1 Tax=Actinomadura graeca TaxID=2750812 RepID=A0ABX8R317_9ACTN|nr:complex I subunit 1 family protein [Actinomadura graeca]QXJ24829.1 NADH-quinone oxidoreductase subunit H [Actinomadura graeca]
MVEVLALGVLALAAASLDAVLADGRSGPGVRAAAAPLREAGRLLAQQRRTTWRADRLLARTGVVSLPVAAALAAVVVPLGDRAAADLPVGIVWFNAMEVVAWASVWLAGWGANSAFALVGGYRFLAQGLAYELPHMLALITAALAAHSLDPRGIAAAQEGLWFVVWMPVAFAVYLLSVPAMAFWGPLAHPVGADLAGGAMAELSGPDRLVLSAGRYGLLTVAAAVAVPLFLGGGAGPLLPAPLWSLVKTCAVLALLVWVRRRVPVLRMDRFMEAAWTVLIPAVLLQMLVVGIVVVS